MRVVTGHRFVFHAATELLPGTDSLQSLSALREIDEEAFGRGMQKYATPERQRLAETRIPLIERIWTEVVFLTPIHPHAIWTAWRELSGVALDASAFWAIPVEDVPPDAVVFDRQDSIVGEPIPAHEVSPFDRATHSAALQTTSGNRAWLSELVATGRRGGWFNRTPHVLTAGPVPLINAQVISWDSGFLPG
jgi:hypothetical protein